MMAILRELLRQHQSLLALVVFAEIQKEHWYKPDVSLYAEIILVLAKNGLFDKVDWIFLELKSEKGRLEAKKTEDFNKLLQTLMSYNLIELTMDCFELMKEEEAHKNYGDSLEFIDEQERDGQPNKVILLDYNLEVGLVPPTFSYSRRSRREGNADPILLNEIDDSNEWMMGRMKDDCDDGDDLVYVGEDLTWGDVERASGANEPSYSTRASRQSDEDDFEEDIEASNDDDGDPIPVFDDDDDDLDDY
ncbi:thylakoid assembly 8-like protein, chloroplastic [Tanacetum coccineum]